MVWLKLMVISLHCQNRNLSQDSTPNLEINTPILKTGCDGVKS